MVRFKHWSASFIKKWHILHDYDRFLKEKHESSWADILCFLVPEVAGVGSGESVDVQTDVSQGKVEHKEVTGRPQVLHSEEGDDVDGIKYESKQT